MPNCTVRYQVRLVPKTPGTIAVNAIGVFTEERLADDLGEPGPLLSRRLETFTGPAGSSIKAMVTHGDGWHVDVQQRVGPLEWDG